MTETLGHLKARGTLPRNDSPEVAFIGSLFRYFSGEGEILHLPAAGGMDAQPWDLMGWILRTQQAIKGHFSDRLKKGQKHGKN